MPIYGVGSGSGFPKVSFIKGHLYNVCSNCSFININLYQMYFNPKAHIAMNKYFNGLSLFIFTFLEIEETDLFI